MYNIGPTSSVFCVANDTAIYAHKICHVLMCNMRVVSTLYNIVMYDTHLLSHM